MYTSYYALCWFNQVIFFMKDMWMKSHISLYVYRSYSEAMNNPLVFGSGGVECSLWNFLAVSFNALYMVNKKGFRFVAIVYIFGSNVWFSNWVAIEILEMWKYSERIFAFSWLNKVDESFLKYEFSVTSFWSFTTISVMGNSLFFRVKLSFGLKTRKILKNCEIRIWIHKYFIYV